MGVFASHLVELAHLVGAVAHEGVVGSATAGTLVDASLYQSDDSWNDHYVYVYSGTGIGQERAVADFIAASDTLSVTPNWTTTPTASDKYIILHPTWRIETLRRAFILAMRRRRRFLLVPKVDESVTINMNPTPTYEYNVPAGFVAIQSIIREESPGAGVFNIVLPHSTWYIKKSTTRQISFDVNLNDLNLFLVDGCKLRIIGQAYETEPASDSATLSIPTGNLLFLAASIAHEMMAPHDMANSEKRMALASAMRTDYESRQWDDAATIYQDSQIVEDL